MTRHRRAGYDGHAGCAEGSLLPLVGEVEVGVVRMARLRAILRPPPPAPPHAGAFKAFVGPARRATGTGRPGTQKVISEVRPNTTTSGFCSGVARRVMYWMLGRTTTLSVTAML